MASTSYALSEFLTWRSIPWPALAFAVSIPIARLTLESTLFQVIGAPLVLPNKKKTDKPVTQDDLETLKKFKESLFKFSVYLTFTIWAITVSYKEKFLTDTRYYWLGCTKLPCDFVISQGLQLLYCAEMGYYLQGIPSLVFWELRRKDFWEQIAHHIVTLFLIVYSYQVNFMKAGCMVFLVHDINDIFMEAAKLARYAGHQTLCTVLFVTFMLSWFASRIYYLPFYIIRSTLTEPITLVADVYNVDPAPHYAIFNGLLFFLFGLHCYWSFLHTHAHIHAQSQSIGVSPTPLPSTPLPRHGWRLFGLGAVFAIVLQFVVGWFSVSPVWERFFGRFVWNRGEREAPAPDPPAFQANSESTALVLYSDSAESVEWVNMCWRKAWRVYQRGLERWLADLLQPVFDNLISDKAVPRFVQRLRILEFTLDHEAPYFDNIRRRSSRKDSDLNGVVDVRYTGGARMLLQLEVGQGRWRLKIPVLVSDLDLECQLWLKIRLAPMTPYFGTVSLAFVGPPTIKVQLLPYNRVRLMQVPIVQAFLTHLLTVDLPKLMVLPKRLEINIPPAVTAVAEAAVGRDVVMRAVASAVLQADALENALIAALPLGPQSAAGGVSLPDSFQGELQVNLMEARNLAVWGFPWQSNPYCRLSLGSQVVRSRKDDATSHRGSHKAPVWNQEFHFLVTDTTTQVLEIAIRDSHLTGRAGVGVVRVPLQQLPLGGQQNMWLPVQPSASGIKASGDLHLEVTYKPFEDDDTDSGYREAEAYALLLQQQAITDVKSAADASSRAAVAASAAAAAVAVTKAAAARAATKAAHATRVAAGGKGRKNSSATSGSALQQRPSSSNGADGKRTASGKSGKSKDGDSSSDGAEDQKGLTNIEERLLSEAKDEMSAMSASKEASDSSSGSELSVKDMEIARRNFKRVNSMQREQLGLAGQPLPDAPLPQGITPEQLFPGIEFRVTEEYDEDSPFSRPPGWKPAPSKQDPAPSAPQSKDPAASHDHTSDSQSTLSGGQASSVGSTADSTSNGSAPASASQSTADMAAVKSQNMASAHAEAAAQAPSDGTKAKEPAVGHGQVYSDADTPQRLPVGIEFSDQPDSDQPSSTAVMDTVNQKPGVRRTLDGKGHVAPDRDAEEQGLSPPSQSQSGPSGAPSDSEGSGPGVAWWDSGTASVSGAFESVKSAISTGYHSLSKSQSDSQPPGNKGKSTGSMGSEDDVLDDGDVVVPADLPLEAIAEEVQNSWHLKEVQVEQLMEKAVAQSERPWLVLLTTLSSISAILLTLILLRLQQGGHL